MGGCVDLGRDWEVKNVPKRRSMGGEVVRWRPLDGYFGPMSRAELCCTCGCRPFDVFCGQIMSNVGSEGRSRRPFDELWGRTRNLVVGSEASCGCIHVRLAAKLGGEHKIPAMQPI